MVDSGTYTPEAIARRLAIAQQLLDTSKQKPITHWAEGLNELAKGAVGGYQFNKAEGLERKAKSDSAAAIAQALGIQMPAVAPSASTDTSPIAKIASLFSGDGDTSAPKPPAPIPPAGGGGDFGSAIAGIESGGRYDALGPKTKTGDQAHGKYQVMGANIGPWTKEILGKEMSPQDFLASPEAQDAVFKGKFGQYAQKYGPEGAARAWFAGEGGMNNLDAKDQLGTSVGQYGQKFAQAVGPTAFAGSPGSPQTPAPTPGATPAPTAAAAPAPATDSNKAMIAKLLANPATASLGQGLALKMLAQENTPTNDMREYEMAKRQGFTGSLLDYQTKLKEAGKPVTNINQQQESEYEKATGKQMAELNAEIPKQATAARGKISTLTRMDALLSDPKIYTGAGANLVLDAKRLAKAAGVDIGDVGGAEALRSIGNQFALELRNPSGGAGMPGALSDKDREFLQASVPGLTQNPEGNRLIVDYMKRMAQRSVDVERLRQQYVAKNGRLSEGFYKELADYSDKNPMFTKADMDKASSMAGASQAQPAEVPAAGTIKPPPQAGAVEQGYKFKGGNPADPNSWEKVQ